MLLTQPRIRRRLKKVPEPEPERMRRLISEMTPEEIEELDLVVNSPCIEWAFRPDRFVIEALSADPDDWQLASLRSLVHQDRVAIRSGHGVGKSAWLSWVILWWLSTRYPAKIACTAPTAHQLSDVLWGELALWMRRLPSNLRDRFDLKTDRLEVKGFPNEAFAVARTARKEQPEAFQGFHSENMLFIVDEASGVEDIIFETGEGSMSTAKAKTILVGNPTRGSGYFYNAFHKDRANWWTKRVSCLDSRIADPKYAAKLGERYGTDSNIYRVRALGEFPIHEDDKVIPLSWCEAAVNRDVAQVENYRIVWGVDVARFGTDRTALAKRRANYLLEPVKSWRGKSNTEVAGLIMNEYESVPDDQVPDEILVDVIGLGAGVVDILTENGLPVRGVAASEGASVKTKFLRRRDELWWNAREWFENKECRIPQDDELVADLVGPKYTFTSAGRLIVESKDEMKKRGIESPDLADAFCLTFAGGVTRVDRHVSSRYAARHKNRPRPSTWMGA